MKTDEKKCPICGIYMDEKYLDNHNCPGNDDNVKMIQSFFEH